MKKVPSQKKRSADARNFKIAKPASTKDIIQLIKQDHEPLKKFIVTLKDSLVSLKKKRETFAEFMPLLINHARAEERALYRHLETERQRDLRVESYEGEVEHQLADELLEAVLNEENDDLWVARAKVLAQIVEHHLKEEENILLPDFRRASTSEQRRVMGEKYLYYKRQFEEADQNFSDREKNAETQPLTAH